MIARRIMTMLADLFHQDVPGGPSVPAAGYDLIVALDGPPIDWSSINKAVGVVTEATVPLVVGPDGTRYVVAIRARTASGLVGDPATIYLRLVADGGQLVARPNSPTQLVARPMAGGAVELLWNHDDREATAVAAEFEVFGDGGSGVIDWVTPLETVPPTDRRVELPGTVDTWNRFAVRAVAASGHHDGNKSSVTVVPRNDPPPSLGELLISQVV